MILLERFCEGASASHRPPGAPVQRARRSPIRPRRSSVEESARTAAVADAADEEKGRARRVCMVAFNSQADEALQGKRPKAAFRMLAK
jgi:hypothetical protein